MLDPEAPDERRDQIAADARKRIEGAGELRAEKAWGMRKLAYEIRQRTEADYRFFRFESPSAVLDDLSHSLKIADGVLRFRIFKVDPRLPVIEPPPPMALASAPGRGAGPRRGGPGGRRDEAPAADAADEGEPATPAPAPETPEEAPAAAEAEPASTGESPPPAESAPEAEAPPQAEAASEGDAEPEAEAPAE